MRCDTAFYTVTPGAGVAVFAPPPELAALMMPDALVGMLTRNTAAKAAAAAASTSGHPSAQGQVAQHAQHAGSQQAQQPGAAANVVQQGPQQGLGGQAHSQRHDHVQQQQQQQQQLLPTAGGMRMGLSKEVCTSLVTIDIF